MSGKRSLVCLPKAELHLHLEGSMRFETLLELCGKHGLKPPKDVRGTRFQDFSNFVEMYVAACECLREEADLFRLVQEVAEDAKASGATWIEPALSISVYADRFGGVVPTLGILMRAAEAAETATGVGIGYIIACERHFPVAQAEGLAQIVRDTSLDPNNKMLIHGRRGIVGFGLHGSEGGFPPVPFAKAFQIACEGTGVVSIPHAGEIAPFEGQGPTSVYEACTQLRSPRRIGHGVLAVEDEKVLEHLEQHNVCLDVCVTSNYLLSVVPSLAQHPLPNLLKRGIPCTINSDDPLLFGSSLLEEYELCRSKLGLTDEEIASCANNSFQFSCAPETVVQQGIQGVAKWLANME